jgi:hypothetical protein
MKDNIVSRRTGDEISEVLNLAIEDLESRGHDRGTIGAGMIGVGVGIVAERDGREALFGILDDARLTVEADDVRKN